ncbi:MAG: 5-formyltetrahydrofolate cyclo-ligase [Candidatus Omnitrophota bacterium]
MKTKHTIRERILRALESQAQSERRKKSRRIEQKFLRSKEYKSARVILCYASRPEEVQTDEIIKAALKDGKIVALPLTLIGEKKLICCKIKSLNELALGVHSVRQPRQDKAKKIPVEKIDVAVIPGVAFDKKLNRLGRGAGYYDRFLEALPTNIPKVGFAYKFQLVKYLPSLSHDVPVDKLISA